MHQSLSKDTKTIRKRKRLRSCLIVFLGYLVVSLVIVCVFGGCCTKRALDYDCPRRARLEDRHFGLSPDGREIVYSSVLGIYRQNALGVYNIRSEGPHFEKRIPMDPVPDGMFRFEIAVDVSPDHPPYHLTFFLKKTQAGLAAVRGFRSDGMTLALPRIIRQVGFMHLSA